MSACSGGGGGGGRIALVVTNGAITESVTMSVAGGPRGDKQAGNGGAGTIYVQGAKPSPVVLDFSTLWRQFHVEGPSYLRMSNGILKATQIDWTDGPWHMHQEGCPWGEPGLSVTNVFGHPGSRADGLWTAPPPADWTMPDFEDSAWPRLLWPQPQSQRLFCTPGRFMYDTVLILARGTFDVKDPAQVKECRLSLAYRGGVVVYVNGKELARGHLPAGTISPATPAEDYPVAAFVGGDKPIVKSGANLELPKERLALRERQLRDVAIPVSLLRPGRNVVAIKAHAAPMFENAYTTLRRQFGVWGGGPGWPLVGLVAGRLTISQAAPVVVANRTRPSRPQVWNVAAYDTVTCFDYGNPADPLRPIVIRAGRNTVFSGRLMVGSDQPIKGFKVTVTDLQAKAGAKIPAAAVRVRYAVPATEGKSWLPPYRFDGLLDTIPSEIPLVDTRRDANSTLQNFSGDIGWIPPTWYGSSNPFWKNLTPRISGAVAPLWFTVRVPSHTAPGLYEGQVTVAAEGLPATTVPLQVQVSAWRAPDPRDFRVQNFLYYAEEVIPQYYGVPYWSDRHFEILGQHLSLLAELNSRQVMANLVTGYFDYRGSVPAADESLVRWIKQPDGSYRHDFANFDKYLELVARKIGKPNTLRLNFAEGCGAVTVQDSATGKLSRLPPPAPGTEENYIFWKPVIDEVLQRIKARGWLEETTLGCNDPHGQPPVKLVDIAYRLWPEGEWSWASHFCGEGMVFKGSTTNVMRKVRHADGCLVKPSGRLPPLWALEGPRRYSFAWTSKGQLDDKSLLWEYRRQVENACMGGYDGVGDFGANLYPLKTPSGSYGTVTAGRGTRWAQQFDCIYSLLYPAPDGPVATERYEMFREGLELYEASLYVQNAIHKKLLSAELEQRAKRYLYPQEKPGRMTQQIRGERDNTFNRGWFSATYMLAVEDAKLLDLAGEVARELEK
jgi:hypothetical protein